MRIRTFSTGLLVATVMVIPAACGSSDPEAGSGSGGEVTLWMYPVISDDAASQKYWKGVESDFEAEHPEIDLSIELQTFEQRDAQISAALAAGSGPDLVMITPDQLATYRSIDGLAPVTEAIADERDVFTQAALDVATYESELYGVPMFQNISTTAYNVEIFEQAGIDELPTTWEQVREYAPILADQGFAIMDYAGNPEVTLNVSFYPILWQGGGRIFSEDGTDVAFDSPKAVAALEFLVELQQAGGLVPEAATKSNAVEGSPLAEGEVAMRYMTSMAQLDQMKAALGEENVELGPPLTGEKQVTFGNPGMLSLTSISDESNRQAAYEVISYLTSAEVQTSLCEAADKFPTRSDVPAPGDGTDYEVMTKALEYATPGEPHPQARPVMAILAPYVQSALQGDMTAEEALTAAAEEARELLARS
ncbi:carbohydrate ABC transporter substrate-binding protein (CUT1 family) [Haloactinopolyspora alba]|uniref:Carbohydrate ABC transporter substrate-binding protein (CUT1 family) n=1 Tax=Haloactinopolyspora alba TaxID=648780 RepID=A0A2P8E959_9ACTN|nr:sugar ABC transporter substrate-binding protein [Haloactinopolyspora alba]PSL06013.1 carbohydrate ABC transporter substrate-binding protein (CUT1 family) [Haloactinopolyspora alba]